MKMTYDEVLAEVLKVTAAACGVKPGGIQPDDRFIADLDLDSLGLFEVVVDLEDHFQLQIPDEEVDRLETPMEAANLVVKKLNEKKTFAPHQSDEEFE